MLIKYITILFAVGMGALAYCVPSQQLVFVWGSGMFLGMALMMFVAEESERKYVRDLLEK